MEIIEKESTEAWDNVNSNLNKYKFWLPWFMRFRI
jgi:hypothetical protein